MVIISKWKIFSLLTYLAECLIENTQNNYYTTAIGLWAHAHVAKMIMCVFVCVHMCTGD